MQEVADWLNGLGMSEYAPRFAENDIDMEVLGELTDADFDRLGVSLGHRRKLLKALASTAEPTPSKSAIESAERRQVIVGSTSWSAGMDPGDLREASPVSSGLRPAEMISGRFLPRPRVPVSWPIAYDDRHDGAPQAGESAEAFVTDDDHDDPPRWRNRLLIVIAVLALAGLGSAGAFAYRAAFPGPLPTLASMIRAENGPSKNVPNFSDAGPSNSSQTSLASAGSSEEFVSRWPPEPTASITPNPGAAPPRDLGSGAVAPIATVPAAPPSPVTPPAVRAASVPPAAPAPAPGVPEPKRSRTVISRAEGAGRTDTSAAAAESAGAKRNAAAAPPTASRPLSLVPDVQSHVAASSSPRTRVPADAKTEASFGGGYAVQVASERSAADADAAFRTLQAKFPTQIGGREPIVRRSDLGPEGIHYRALIGPFVSKREAAGVCRTLKAAGRSCLVERN